MARLVPESRLRERRRRRRMVRLWILGVAVVLFFIGLVALSRAPFLRITSVAVTGATASTNVDTVAPLVQDLVEQDIAGSYAGLFARNNTLLYPKSALTAALLAHLPEVKSVNIETEHTHTLHVSVALRQPFALWCGPARDTEVAVADSLFTKHSCYTLDENGLAFAVSDGAGGQLQKYFGPAATTSTQADLPKQYLSPQQFTSLVGFVGALGAKVPDDPIISVSVDGAGNAEATFTSGFSLRFILANNPGDVLVHFDLARTTSVFVAHKLADFTYLDLRFGDKIYYKLKNK